MRKNTCHSVFAIPPEQPLHCHREPLCITVGTAEAQRKEGRWGEGWVQGVGIVEGWVQGEDIVLYEKKTERTITISGLEFAKLNVRPSEKTDLDVEVTFTNNGVSFDLCLKSWDDYAKLRDAIKHLVILDCVHLRFKSKGLIGRGSFGKVYLLKEIANKSRHAAKVIKKSSITSKSKELLIDEIRLLRNLKHNGIVKIEEIHETENTIYIIMEYIQGGQVQDCQNLKAIPRAERLTYIHQILNVLVYLKSKKVIHRDLKPDNLLLTKGNKIKLIDFGLGASIWSKREINTRSGSPGFVPPELLNKREETMTCFEYSEKFDLFALGVVYYCMAYGVHPFDAENWQEILERNADCKVKFSGEEVPKDELLLIKSLLKKNPEERITLKESLFLLESIQKENGKSTSLANTADTLETSKLNSKQC